MSASLKITDENRKLRDDIADIFHEEYRKWILELTALVLNSIDDIDIANRLKSRWKMWDSFYGPEYSDLKPQHQHHAKIFAERVLRLVEIERNLKEKK